MTETFPKGWRLGGKHLMSDMISLELTYTLVAPKWCDILALLWQFDKFWRLRWQPLWHHALVRAVVLSEKWSGNNRNAELCPATTQEKSDHSYQHLPSFSEQNKLSIKLQKTAVKAASWQSPESVHIFCCKGFSLSQFHQKHGLSINEVHNSALIGNFAYNICIYLWQHATNKFINTSQPRASSQATASFSSNTSQ